ncbi:hypothetical protein Scep_009427 [Stephania cephalantha]|uniref:Uncharacterized protein n=1 Tax=Stephania cephalantha TaxID=152367 RepID=A0AAP0JT58_9MAGN
MLVTVDREIKYAFVFICIPIYVARMLPWHILMRGGQRVCSLLGGRGGAQLVAEELSPTEDGGMALGEYDLGSSLKHLGPVRSVSISRTKF